MSHAFGILSANRKTPPLQEQQLPPQFLVGELAPSGPQYFVWRSTEAGKYSHEQLIALADPARATYGERSPQYVSALLQVGELLMMRGLTAYPKALDVYNQAVFIATQLGDDALLAARALDGLACVKQASDDYAGAASDLSAAITIWRNALQQGDSLDAAYLVRREEDLASIEGVIRVRSHRPPEWPPTKQ
jgi:hypothetical protein